MGVLIGIFIILIFLIFSTLPSWLMVGVASWKIKKKIPKSNLFVRMSIIGLTLVLVSFCSNIFIHGEVSRLASEGFGERPNEQNINSLAVRDLRRLNSNDPRCDKDCLLMLISDSTQEYIVSNNPKPGVKAKMTAFSFQNQSSCDVAESTFASGTSSDLKQSVRLLALSGQCLQSKEVINPDPDILIEYLPVHGASRALSSLKRTDINIWKKANEGVGLEQVYRGIALRYHKIQPIFLPVIRYDRRKWHFGIWRTGFYKAPERRRSCKLDIWAEYDRCKNRYDSRGRKTLLAPPSTLMGFDLSERSLRRSDVLLPTLAEPNVILSLVDDIILVDREPNEVEWNAINQYISHDYAKDSYYTSVVIKVIRYKKFPIPNLYFGVDRLDSNSRPELVNAVMRRVVDKSSGPVIGGFDEKSQSRYLYKIIEKLKPEELNPHINTLTAAVINRPRKNLYVEFFEKLGPKSIEPMIEIIATDRRRVGQLAPVMCKMGSQLSGIEEPLMKMAESGEISLQYRSLIYLLLSLGIEEARILAAVDPSKMGFGNNIDSITNYIDMYNSGRRPRRC